MAAAAAHAAEAVRLPAAAVAARSGRRRRGTARALAAAAGAGAPNSPPASPPPGARPPATLGDLRAFAVPALGVVLVAPVMSLADTLCVAVAESGCSPAAAGLGVAALGPNSAVFAAVAQAFSAFTTVTVALVARAKARGDAKAAASAAETSLWLAAIVGAAVGLFLCCFAHPVLVVLATPEAVFEEARAYLLVRALSLPALLVHTVASAVCIALGDPRTPLVTSVAAAALNLALDGGLVLWPLRLGAVGAAWATLAATVFGAVLLVRRATTVVGAKWPPARPAWVQARPFLAANGVLQVRNAALMASVSLMTAAAATLGTAVLAMHQLLYSILSVAQFLPEPVSQSVQAHLTGLSKDEGEVSMEEAAEIRAGARLHLTAAAMVGALSFVGCIVATRLLPLPGTAALLGSGAVGTAPERLALASGLLALVCVSDGLVLASGWLRFAAASQVAVLVPVALALAHATDLSDVWSGMILFQAGRLLLNILAGLWARTYRRRRGMPTPSS